MCSRLVSSSNEQPSICSSASGAWDGVIPVCGYVLNCNISLAPTGCASFVHDAHVVPLPCVQDQAHTVAASEQGAKPDSEAGQTIGSSPLQQQQLANSSWQYDKGCWEAFHARDNATARFYKERRSISAALLTILTCQLSHMYVLTFHVKSLYAFLKHFAQLCDGY